MRKYLYVPLIAASALVVAAPLAAQAAAGAPVTHVLTIAKAGAGAKPVKPRDHLSASLATGATAVFSTKLGKVTCKSATSAATVTSNPAAPGTARESLTALTVGTCRANVPHLRVLGIRALNLPYVVKVSSTGLKVRVSGHSTTAPLRFRIRLKFHTLRFRCSYAAASISGTASNTGNTVTFTLQKFTKVAGRRICPRSARFSATFGPVLDVTVTGHPAVFVN